MNLSSLLVCPFKRRNLAPMMVAMTSAALCLTSSRVQASTIADWKFNEANPTLDSSTNNNTLTFNGNLNFPSDVATNAPGRPTNSVLFDGVTYAQTINTLDLSTNNQLTIELFAKYATGNGLEMFYSQNNPNNVAGAFYLDSGESSATGLKVAQRSMVGFTTQVSPGPTDGAWHHIALTMDETAAIPVFRIYVDGYEVETGSFAGSANAFLNDYFTIGAYPPTYIFFYQGLMGEMRISSGILTPTEFLIGAQAPAILVSQQPQNTGVVTNSPASFSVIASAQGGNPTPVLKYQWQKNGVNIPGATNSNYVLTAPALNDDQALFDVILSATGVAPVTSSNALLTVRSSSTLADWKFDAANPTLDSSGNSNTLVLNGNITFSGDVATNAPGVTNSATFDGASYAQTVGTLNLSNFNQLTLEIFTKYTSANGLEMFYSQNNPNNVPGAFYLDTGEATTTGLKAAQGFFGGFTTQVSAGPTDGAWHHIALTMDQSGTNPVFKIYVDGYEVETGGLAGRDQAFINDFFTIGAYPPNYIFNYSGLMGEMRVSLGILNQAQFLIGAPAPKISISRQPQNTTVLTNSAASFSVAAAAVGANPLPSLQYQWQKNGANISGATNSTYTLPSATLGDSQSQFDVVVSCPPGIAITSSNAVLIVVTNTTIADWKFDAANPTFDSSGNSNTLTLNGNITFSSDVDTNAPGATNSAVFDGASYAQTVNTLNLTNCNQLTFEFFSKYTSGNGLEMFFSQNNPNNVTGAFYLDTGESSATGLKVAQTSAAGFATQASPGPTNGAWHHIAVTMDESGAVPVFRIYVDGLEVETGGFAGGVQTFINDYFTIGAYPPTYVFNYQGLMGEMRISTGILATGQFLTGPAKLQISASGGSIVVSWPKNAGTFSLQQTSQLPGTWTSVAASPVLSGLNYQVTIPVSTGAKFYRLVR